MTTPSTVVLRRDEEAGSEMRLGSRIGLGTAPLGSSEDGPLWWGPQERSTGVDTVRAALDAGIAWVDTAPFYGWGRAEEIVGEAVRGRRDEVTILTKCGTIRRADGSVAEDGSPAAIRADLEASLARLGTDRVDVLQLHDPDPDVPVEESVGALRDLVAEGKVVHVGLSNHGVDLLQRAQEITPIEVVQHQWSILHHPASTDAARQWCEQVGAAFLGWSPLASGFLVDGFDPERTAPGDLRRRLPWASGEGAHRLMRVRAEATASGRPLREYALAWVMATAYPIVGARTPAEARALALALDPRPPSRPGPSGGGHVAAVEGNAAGRGGDQRDRRHHEG